MDTQRYLQARYEQTTPDMAWQSQSLSAMGEWQNQLRQRLRNIMGGFDGWSCPLNPRTTADVQLDGYRRETIVFTSRPGLEVIGHFLTPNGCAPLSPAILCFPGHGPGLDDLVGIAADGSQRQLGQSDEYHKDFALQCVERGYPTFAIEQISFGHRRDQQARDAGRNASSCTRDSMGALMLGETMIGWRVWDAIRSLDYMQTRPEVNPERMATLGISGGGLTSLFAAAMDERVYAAVVSGYFSYFRACILAMDHCPDNYAPGLLNAIEMPDLAGLIAPRSLFVENGTHDPIFPIAAFYPAVDRAKEIYSAFGVPDHFGSEVFEGEHQFHGVEALRFLDKSLRG